MARDGKMGVHLDGSTVVGVSRLEVIEGPSGRRRRNKAERARIAAEGAMKTPAFPYHLGDDECKAVMNHAAHMFADEAVAAAAVASAKSIPDMRAKLADEAVVQGLTVVAMNWTNERLKKLEAEVRAGRERIAQLEARNG